MGTNICEATEWLLLTLDLIAQTVATSLGDVAKPKQNKTLHDIHVTLIHVNAQHICMHLYKKNRGLEKKSDRGLAKCQN